MTLDLTLPDIVSLHTATLLLLALAVLSHSIWIARHH